MILTIDSGEHLGWFSWSNAYDRMDCISEGVYAYYFGEDKPDKDVMPYELEDTFYIGMACGTYHDIKNRKTWNGVRKKHLQKRLLDHNSYLATLLEEPLNMDKLSKEKKLEIKKSKMFFEHFSPPLNPQCQRWVSITLPPKDCKTVALRSHVRTVEELYTLEYTNCFDNLPLLNFDQIYESDRQRNSYSNRMMSSPSILKFCE
jgi:hypothetical protein